MNILTDPKIIDLFSNISLFAHLDSSEIEKLISKAEPLHYKRGEEIVCEGETGHGMYVIKCGAAQAYTQTHSGDEAILSKLESGQYFGEQSLIPGGSSRRNASVRATMPTEVLYIPAKLYRSVVLINDEMVKFLQATGEEQLRENLLQQSTVLRVLSLQGRVDLRICEEHFKDGETVFNQGDLGDKFYLVVSGTALATTHKDGKSIQIIGRIPAGRYFGELALINSEPRKANIVAEGDLRVLSLEADAFRKLYDTSPELRDQMSHLCGIYQLSSKDVMTLHETSFLDMKSITAMYHFPNGIKVSSLKVVGKAIFSMSRLDANEIRTRRISYTQSNEGIMRELHLLGNRIVSVSAYGNWMDLGRVHQQVLNNKYLWPWQLALFRQTGELWLEEEKNNFDDDAIICNCTGVTRGTLNKAIAEGCSSVQELAQATGASQVCGSCAPRLVDILGQTDMKPAELLATITVTDEIKTFRFKPVVGECSPSLPGQHIRIEAQLEGRWVQRAYTLSSPAGLSDYYEITVKREQQGLFSRWLHDKLNNESLVRISTAQGNYYLPDSHTGPIACFVGGIGTTPALCIMRTLINRNDCRPLYVDYSAKTKNQFAYMNEWQTVSASHNNININFRASDEQGRVQQQDVDTLHEKHPDAMYFICGSKPFQDTMVGYIHNAGVDEKMVKVESFVPPGGNNPAIPSIEYRKILLTSSLLIMILSIVGFLLTDSVKNNGIWANEEIQQFSGFTMLAMVAIGMLMSFKKRWKSLSFVGNYMQWRLIHVVLGVLLLILLMFHVSIDWGHQLHDLLLYTTMLAIILGSLSTISILLENKFNSHYSKKLRIGFYWMHLISLWPLLGLLSLHVFTVYYF